MRAHSSRPATSPFGAAALVLGGCLAGLVLSEAGARLLERAWGWTYYSSFNMGPVKRGLALYQDSYEFGYESTPNVGGNNSLGFKNEDYPLAKRRGVFRVMLAGDSLAEAYGDVLRAELSRLMPPGRTLELWNISAGGYNLSQYVRRLRRRGLLYEPDLVILFHCLNDLDYGVPVLLKQKDRFVATQWSQGPGRFDLPGASLFWSRSALYRMTALTVMDRRARRGLLPQVDREIHAAEELQGLLEDCRPRAVPVVSVIFPFLIPEASYKRWQQEARQMFPRVLRAVGIPFLDLAHDTPDRARLSLRVRPEDYVHMSHQASRPYMRRVARRLQKDGLLPADSP